MGKSFFPESTPKASPAGAAAAAAVSATAATSPAAPSTPDTAAAPGVNRRTVVAIAASAPLVAAAVSLLTRRPAVAAALPDIPAAEAVVESAGYHETDHIRRYYRSAKYF